VPELSVDSVPVLVVVHRRPEHVARVMEQLRIAQPSTLFVAADIPASGADDDAHREALRLATSIDWPCELRVTVSEAPLGCSPRILSAIDWAFGYVDRLMVIEDDIVIDPSFVSWAGAMLTRYEHETSIGHISGRNELIRWSPTTGDHLIVRRGSMWGWATWRDVWERYRKSPPLDAPTESSLLDEHTRLLVPPPGASLIWDVDWSRFLLSSALHSVVPSVNLVNNIGFGVNATHTTAVDDIRADFPVGSSVPSLDMSLWVQAGVVPDSDLYDEAALLVDLMATFRNPSALARLSRLVTAGMTPELDAVTLHHLAPFRCPEKSARTLAHLRGHGVDADQLFPIEQALVSVKTNENES
jgi:hypothetical protein